MINPPQSRQLGLPMATALVVGNMIGAGIFLLPAQLAPYGRNAIYGWLVAFAGVLCLALSFMVLSRRIRGGPFVYVERAFGPLAAFLVMWAYLVSIWVGLPPLAIAAVSYLSHLAPTLGHAFIAPATAIAFLWFLVLINSRGARAGGVVQLITSVLKVVPLVVVALVAAIAFGSGSHSGDQSTEPFSGGALAGAAALAMFSMLGFESATIPADKIRKPERTVPIATIGGTILTAIIYIGAYASVLFLLSANRTAASPAPFADAVQPLLGAAAGTAITLFAVISALGCLNGWVLVAGEVPLTLARDGVFPEWLGKTTRLGTPVRAQVIAGALSTILILSNYSKSMAGLFAFSALVTTVSSMFLYIGVAGAAISLAAKGHAPLKLVAPSFAGLLFALWIVWGAGAQPALWGLALLATGVPIYWLTAARSSRQAEGNPAAPAG